MITCAKCGRDNEDRYKFCLGCGSPLSAPAPVPAPDAQPAASGARPIEPVEKDSTPTRRDHRATDPGRPGGDLEAVAAALSGRQQEAPIGPSGINRGASKPGFDSGPPISRPNPSSGDVPAANAGGGSAGGGRACTSCGAEVPPSFLFCGRCGVRFDEPEPPARDAAAVAPMPAQETAAPTTGSPAPLPAPVPTEPVPEVEVEVEDAGDNDTMMTSPVRGRLVLIHPDGTEGDALGLTEGRSVFGSATNTPLLEGDEYVSPQHIAVTCREGRVVVEDLDTLNGVFLRLDSAPVELEEGDEVRIGQELLRYVPPGDEPVLIDGRDQVEVHGSDPEPSTFGWLFRVTAPDQVTNQYRLDGNEEVIGREVGTILFREDGFVSGRHARLSPAEGRAGALLHDLNSSNGTYIRLKEPYIASDGDFLLIGQQLFHVHLMG